MTISKVERSAPRVESLQMTADALVIELNDGRSISIPLVWYPRLLHATAKERGNWRLVGQGQGVHWDDLDEDLSVRGLLEGHRSAESQASFQRWLAGREKRPKHKA